MLLWMCLTVWSIGLVDVAVLGALCLIKASFTVPRCFLNSFEHWFFEWFLSFVFSLHRMLSLPESLPESTSCLHIGSVVRTTSCIIIKMKKEWMHRVKHRVSVHISHVAAGQTDRLYFVLQPAQLLKGDIMVSLRLMRGGTEWNRIE